MKVFYSLIYPMLAALSLATVADAHPVIYQGGTVIEQSVREDYARYHINHTLTPDFAMGATYHQIKSKDAVDKSVVLQTNLLLLRYMDKDSQANLYALGGVGVGSNQEARVYRSIQTDWETRTLYAAASSEALSGDSIHFGRYRYRLGISPYKAGYQELQPWMLLQIEKKRSDRYPSVGPVMRFFKKTALWEIGAIDGAWIMNFMIHL